MSQPPQSDSVFWIEVDKVRPNPYQPRHAFDQRSLEDLADSIRQYGVLQPLTVTRHEEQTESGMSVYYELIAGERRLRASKLAGLQQVPAIIRSGEETNKMKLELAIIENLQREDLNPIDRAYAFRQLNDEFSLTHAQIGKRMGKSREYVSNTLRLLQLPEYVQEAVRGGKMMEGHTRPLQMLRDRPEEMDTLFKEILYKKLSVRDAEKIARSIAKDKVRKPTGGDPTLSAYAERFSKRLGTRVMIEKREKGKGGKIVIDYFTPEDLDDLLQTMKGEGEPKDLMQQFVERKKAERRAAVQEESPEKEAPAASLDQVFGGATLRGEPIKELPEITTEVEETKKEAEEEVVKESVPAPEVPAPTEKMIDFEHYGTDFEDDDEDDEDELAALIASIPRRGDAAVVTPQMSSLDIPPVKPVPETESAPVIAATEPAPEAVPAEENSGQGLDDTIDALNNLVQN